MHPSPLVAGLVLGEEELGIEPLAHQPALHVGEARDHGVDRARGDVLPQLLERRHRRRHYTGAEGCNVRHIPLASLGPGRTKEGENVSSDAPGVVAHDDDESTLHKLGYAQVLFREMGGFSNFAISFTIISILAGCLTSYFIAFENGGPIAITWGWLMVGFFVVLVALAMGEVASSMPTAGAIYYWASKIGSPAWGWFTGWFNLIGQIGVTAAINYGAAIFWTSLMNLWFPSVSTGRHTVFLTFTSSWPRSCF